MQGAVRPPGGSHEDPGYSYFSDGKGWERKPGQNGRPGPAPGAAASPPGPAPGGFRPGSDATSVYGGGPGGPGGYGPPVGPPGAGGPGAPGGWVPPGSPLGPGPGGPTWPGGPGGPGGPIRPGGPARPGGPRGPRVPNGKRKGSWWRHWTWKKAAAVAGGVFVFFALALFGGYQYMSSSATIPVALASANYQNTTVYYADGKTVLGTFGATNRQDLTFQQIPAKLQDAVVAAEDKNFWTEGGISPTGILRAAIHDVTSGGGDLNGGSTITQEFVRGYYDGVGTQQTASRKIKEVFIAQKLAASKSKQWIMTNYLNLIYLGENSYGVQAAAQTYFGQPVAKLSVAQDAVIAGIVQQPSTFPLLSNRAALTARWKYVLQQMVADGYITQAQMSTMKFPTMLTDKAGSASAGTSIKANNGDLWAPYLMAQVENELTGLDGVTQQQLETGGLKVVTTIKRSMQAQMYKAVSENLNSESIRNTPDATVTSLPSWALVGAELQDPKSGQIIAEYPGKGQNLPPAQCKVADCDVNTAVYAREQVGSSFKPYVLATAVSEGMNVKTSTLNASTELCVPPDTKSAVLSSVVPFGTSKCTQPDYFPVSNDGGEVIGSAKKGGGTTVQNALAQSSNTAFSDLAHRAGTASIATMAGQFGVNLAPYKSGGSGLTSYEGEVGMALGIAPLTVNEQTTMLSTIANNGLYHQAHIIKFWQLGDGTTQQMPKVDQHIVLNPDLDAQVQYAMEQTTIDGTAAQTVTYGQQTPGTVIGKTGTTTNSHAGFFIGATSQYSLVVGMFTSSQDTNSNDNLSMLGGGGFGGYWPAKIWNTFAQSVFSKTPSTFSTSPTFTGAAWNQVGKLPKAKPVCTKTVHGHKVKVPGKGCPNPTPKPTCTTDSFGNQSCNGGNPDPTSTCQNQNDPNCFGGNPDPTSTCQNQNDPNCNGNNPNPTSTCQNQNDPNCNGNNPTPTSTCQGPNDPNCNGNGGGGSTGGNSADAPTTPSTQAGLAVGGGLLILPGSLLWSTVSRRRRRKERVSKAE
jgi:membrane peptidoglycan carboxypeptidase